MTSGAPRMDERLADALMERVEYDMLQLWRRLGLPLDDVVFDAWEPRIVYIDRDVRTLSHRVAYDIFIRGETQPHHRREIRVSDHILE